MNVRYMPAGREMDVLVATRVMGWEVWHHGDGRDLIAIPGSAGMHTLHDPHNPGQNWTPSQDNATALVVVNELKSCERNFLTFRLDCVNLEAIKPEAQWKAAFTFRHGKESSAVASHLALAICRAALLAVGVEEV